jgi:hypothetical protein
LSPTNTRASSPEGATSQQLLSAAIPPEPVALEEDDSDDEDAIGDMDDDLEEDGEEITGHHVTSAKTVPGKQPRPLGTSTKTNGAGDAVSTGSSPATMNRTTVGGKGKRGEEALEHAVAAREEVERRRVELKDQPGGGGRSSKMAAREAAAAEGEVVEAKVKDEEVEEEVLHGEDAEETLAPVSAEPSQVALEAWPRWLTCSRSRGKSDLP